MSQKVRRGLYGKMAGDTTLTGLLGTPAPGRSQSIYYDVVPSKASFPYVVFSKSTGMATYSMKTPGAAFNSEVWLIKGVVRDDETGDALDKVEQVSSRLDALLTDAVLSISAAQQMDLRRESDVDYVEDASGTAYRHSGALFRLTYQ